MVYAWCMYGVCVVYVWCMRGAYMVYAWCMYGVYVVYAWSVLGICVLYAIRNEATQPTVLFLEMFAEHFLTFVSRQPQRFFPQHQ